MRIACWFQLALHFLPSRHVTARLSFIRLSSCAGSLGCTSGALKCAWLYASAWLCIPHPLLVRHAAFTRTPRRLWHESVPNPMPSPVYTCSQHAQRWQLKHRQHKAIVAGVQAACQTAPPLGPLRSIVPAEISGYGALSSDASSLPVSSLARLCRRHVPMPHVGAAPCRTVPPWPADSEPRPSHP